MGGGRGVKRTQLKSTSTYLMMVWKNPQDMFVLHKNSQSLMKYAWGHTKHVRLNKNPTTVISALVKQNPFFEEKQSKEHVFDQTWLFELFIYCDLKFSSKINWKVQDLIVLNQINLLINLYLRINRVISKPSWVIQTPTTIPISSKTIKYSYKLKLNQNFFYKNDCKDPPKVCTKFGVSSTSLS